MQDTNETTRSLDSRFMLVSDFFHYAGPCRDMLTEAEHCEIGDIALGYTDSGLDWSFIRDAEREDIDAMHTALTELIAARGITSEVKALCTSLQATPTSTWLRSSLARHTC